MLKKIARTFFLVNKHTAADIAKSTALPLCSFAPFDKFSEPGTGFYGPDFYDTVTGDKQAFEFWRKMVPYAILCRKHDSSFNLVVKARYLPEVKTLEFIVLDAAGFYKKYVDIEHFVPITWEDFSSRLQINVPPFEEVDQEMVFRHGMAREYYFFAKDCQWDATGANHPDLDFRNTYKETEWLDDQITKW